MTEYEIITLKTGLTSLRSLIHRETFHPVIGPVAEAQILHVDQQRLLERSLEPEEPLVVWDVGLGAAANALVTLDTLLTSNRPFKLISFDRTCSGVCFALEHAAQLTYVKNYKEHLLKLMNEKQIEFARGQSWSLIEGDFRISMQRRDIASPHAILYDPYSPQTNHEMWTLDHFAELYQRLSLSRPCLITNYTRSTAVRVTLLLAGFYVGVGCIVGEKTETTVASNCAKLVDRPLTRGWLERVRASSNAAPRRAQKSERSPISDADFKRLAASAQFIE